MIQIPLPTLENYTDLHQIDSGGSSIIYSAHDQRHNRKVAIKVLTARSLDLTVQQSFTRELKAMELVSDHPHILPMLDSGFTTDAAPYIVMPLFTNGSYSDRIKTEGTISWVETVDVGIKIASALQAAHDRHVLHRDVKTVKHFRRPFPCQPCPRRFRHFDRYGRRQNHHRRRRVHPRLRRP